MQIEGGEMPRQYFRITRAPEAEPVNERWLKSLIHGARSDSEWEVTEVDLAVPSHVVQRVRELLGNSEELENSDAGQ